MSFFTLFYKNILFLVALLLVSFFTLNIISPLHEDLMAISLYAIELIAIFIAIGFIALKFKKPYVMLVCFVGSISLCNHLQNNNKVGGESLQEDRELMSSKNLQPNLIKTTLKNINTKNQSTNNISHLTINNLQD